MRRTSAIAGLAVLLTLVAGCAQSQDTIDAAGPSATNAPPLSLVAPPGSDSGTDDTTVGGQLGAKITPAPTADYLAAVAGQTKQVNTGRFQLVTAVTGGAGHEGQTTVLSQLDGAYDRDAQKSRIALDSSGATEAGATGLAAMGTAELIQIGSTGYLKFSLLGDTDTWTKVDQPDQSAFSTIFDMFKVEDIANFLESLRCAGPVTEVGKEEVEQVETTHYRAEVDIAKLQTCQETDTNAGRLLSNFGDATTGTVDVWVDGNSLVRKLVNTANEQALGAELAAKYPGGTSTLTMVLSGFGEPVDIEPPPADQIGEGGGLPGLGDLEQLFPS